MTDALDPALLATVRRQVPRYTSYPTAPHFSAEVDGAVHAGWLEETGRSAKPVSLYLHVPFCRSICHYCGCTTKAVRRDEPVRAYADMLRREIALVADRLGPVEVSHIHWGGGTPAILPPDCMAQIVRDLAARFRFGADMEHAIELDPRHVSRESALHLASLGVTRASLGVQTLDEAVQEAIGRVQPLAMVRAASAYLHEAGIHAINMDLIYGLPGQDAASIRGTVEGVTALAPSRIALFGYAHVPWMKSHQKLIEEASLPDAAERLAQARLARRLLLEAGYRAIGIDHFTRPGDPLAMAEDEGRLRRNFQGYTDDAATETLVGLGASSISRTPFGYAQNAADNAGWARAVEAGRLPVVRGRALVADDRLRAAVIEAILCRFAVDLAAVAREHDADPAPLLADAEALRPMIDAGWVAREGTLIAIRRHAPEIARVVASAFDGYLANGAGRHSMAA